MLKLHKSRMENNLGLCQFEATLAALFTAFPGLQRQHNYWYCFLAMSE